MTNSFKNTQEVARELMVDFQYKSPLLSTMWKEFQSRFLQTESWDIGKTIEVGLPNQYNVGDGATIVSIPDFDEKTIQLSLDYRKHIAMDFTTEEMTTFTKFKFRERILDPASDTLAAVTESLLARFMFNNTYFVTGTAGVCPSSYASVARLRSTMNILGIPKAKRWMMFDEDCYTEVISAGTLQNSFDMKLTRDINREAQLGRIAQFQTFSSPLTYKHIAGIGDGTATPAAGLVACGNVKTTVAAGGNTLIIENLPNSQADTLYVGDKLIFGITGSFHPYHIQPKVKNNTPLRFSATITALSSSTTTSGGEITVTIAPGVETGTTNPYRNISNTAGLQALTSVSLVTANTGSGSTVKVPYKMNFGYVKNALIFAAPPLRMPEGIPANAKNRIVDKNNGLSLRLYTFTDGTNDTDTKRLDILFGLKVYGPLIVGLLG